MAEFDHGFKVPGIGDFFTLNQKPDTYIARVRYSFPWLNLYVVEPAQEGSATHTLYLASGADTSTSIGSVLPTYDAGSYVLVHSDSSAHGSMALADYIVGHATAPINEPKESAMRPDSSVAPLSKISDILDTLTAKLKLLCGKMNVNAPKAFNAPSDILSGDTSVFSSPGVGISVLKHLTRIQCGKGCFIELDSILSRIRVVTSNMEYIGPLKHYHDMSGRGSLVEYNRTAISFKEGTRGATDEDPDLKAMFRKTDVAGDMTSGWQTSVSVPSASDNTFSDVYSSKVRYDGEATIVSAKGFEIRKSLDINTPYQIVDTGDVDSYIAEVDEFPELPNNYGTGDEDSLMLRTIERISEDDSRMVSEFPRVGANTDTWALSGTNREDSVQLAVESERNRTLTPIGDKQYYDLPDTIDIKDPHTGNVYTYFKSTSGFRQDPDGSLVLYDGYGSEIRMVRGNIIISSAIDTIIRPGRDIHTMAGRHTAIVSQKDVTVHSSTSDVMIKGDHDVSILAGLTEDGGILLDDRGDRGILIRAKSNASVTGKDVFVGSLPEEYPDTLIGASEGSGTVTIGGGKSTLIKGASISLYGESVDTIARRDKNISWLSVDSNRIANISEYIRMSGEVYVGQMSGTLTATIGNASITVGNRSKSSVLKVATAVEVANGISCRQLWADQVIAVRAGIGNARTDSGVKAIVKSPNVKVDTAVLDQSNDIYAVYGGPWLDSFNLGYSFKYRSSRELGISSGYTVHGMLWQRYLKGGTVWSEKEITDIRDPKSTSMVYPGKDAWGGDVVYSINDRETINGGYKINGRAG